MRRMLWISAAAVLVFPAANMCVAGQQSQSQDSQSQSQTDSQKTQQSQQSTSSAPSQAQKSQDQATPAQDSLAAAARKSREQKKEAVKPAKVFTNDNMPDSGGISTVGGDKDSTGAAAGAQDSPGAANPEKTWRDRFAKLRHKLDQDQDELDVLQREAAVDQTQFYGGDPSKAMNDQTSGTPFGADFAKKVTQIDAKKKEIEADKQAISDAEEELRKSGGDPGWAR